MTELFRHIGPDTDVPAGDMNVGGREIGYLFGQYKRLANEFTGVLTGKALSFGGSLIRPEATGYGDVYFAENMLAKRGETFEGKRCVISGSGNVASFAAEKLMQLGAKVLTLSDRSGAILCESGITEKMLKDIMYLKNVTRGELADFAKKTKAVKFFKGVNSWQLTDKIDAAFPCARQNELNGKDAAYLLKHGCTLVGEGANMPSTPDAIDAFVKAKIMYSPGKASNAGGVATSGLEMSQNSERLSWSREEVDAKLKGIMKSIHDNARKATTWSARTSPASRRSPTRWSPRASAKRRRSDKRKSKRPAMRLGACFFPHTRLSQRFRVFKVRPARSLPFSRTMNEAT